MKRRLYARAQARARVYARGLGIQGAFQSSIKIKIKNF